MILLFGEKPVDSFRENWNTLGGNDRLIKPGIQHSYFYTLALLFCSWKPQNKVILTNTV